MEHLVIRSKHYGWKKYASKVEKQELTSVTIGNRIANTQKFYHCGHKREISKVFIITFW